jgi:predicted aldo/keto reductase-like oxidoreductase
MTREEQIDWLCRLRANLNNGVIFTPWNKEFTEALNDVLEQEPIMDQIRAEIANHCGVNTDYCDSCRFCTDSIGLREILQIIDKYKAESEG